MKSLLASSEVDGSDSKGLKRRLKKHFRLSHGLIDAMMYVKRLKMTLALMRSEVKAAAPSRVNLYHVSMY